MAHRGMKFGIFLAPYHCPAGQNPTTAFERDLDVLRLADALGFEEAWIGEHHSCGSELIPDPFLFVAHAINHVRHLRLGTGVRKAGEQQRAVDPHPDRLHNARDHPDE